MSQASRRIAAGGVYQPRSKGAAMQDALADARAALGRLMRLVIMRGAGALLFLGSFAAMVALLSYDSSDPSWNNATGNGTANLLGGPGALAADMLLEGFGIAAIFALAPPLVWGIRALRGQHLKHAMWRATAWPLGLVLSAAGLGVFPAFMTLPAGDGGWIGIAAAKLSTHVGDAYHQSWIALAMPVVLLLAGLPLSFLATGLRLTPILRGIANIPAAFLWVGAKVKMPPESLRKISLRKAARDYDEDDREPTFDDEPEHDDADAYALDVAPEPIAAARLAERQQNRVKREEAKKAAAATNIKRAKQPALDLVSGEYQLPALSLLAEPVSVHDEAAQSDEALEENARMLEAVLTDFGVKGRIMAVRPGPVVTLYEFEPAAGVKSSRVISLSDDVARSMSAVAARIATIPGRNVIGIELPNQTREIVYLREMLASGEYDKARMPLVVALGKTIGGEPVMADLAKMPHLLVAGTTGSGKSVGLNTMILSLLYRLTPQQCRLIMIDPKMLELSVYDGIPHLLSPVVTDPKKAVVALKWAVREMEDRYRKMSKLGVRGVEAFNDRVRKAKEKGESLKRTVQTGFDRETGKPIYEDEVLELEPMPFIVIVVDEMADLMMISGKEIEGAVQRLAQMARAAGLHLIAATQRPSVDVITGTIKANFPTRISFQVTSKIDSRTILGEQGAEQLLGHGDMLYMAAGGRIRRIHGPFVSDHEVEDVVRFLKSQGSPEYLDAVTEEPDEEGGDDPYALMGAGSGGNSESGDDLYDKALAIVARERKATTSYLQRRLQIGYNKAASLIERMEHDGVVSRPNHKGLREVLLPDHDEA
ncbi:MAG TPA: DNA translocase FtsK 4TM domain-containing protein [Rhizomicrobium sp.]|jgi:S-DNA-T family DNA segregation ATPase FtsK/SpoIIIE|nr:DNA translocase FtsK 4TM domain-containing protein [Rhizomicrobium sp.]